MPFGGEAEEKQTAALKPGGERSVGFDMMMYQTMKTPGLIQKTLCCPDGSQLGGGEHDPQPERESGNGASAFQIWEDIKDDEDWRKRLGSAALAPGQRQVLRAFIPFCQACVLLLKVTFKNTLPRAFAE